MSRWHWILQMIYWHAGTFCYLMREDYWRAAICGVGAIAVWTLRDPFEESLRGRILCRLGIHAWHRDWGDIRCRRCNQIRQQNKQEASQ